jgi:SAM-dependent methyltransferase
MIGNQLDHLKLFIEKTGSSLTPKEFYDQVNSTFHDCESEIYDNVHKDMFVFLESIFTKLLKHIANDSAKICKDGSNPRKMSILDIGSGTGLVEEFLHRNRFIAVESICVVDPNKKMTKRLLAKNVKKWGFNINVKNCYLEEAGLCDSSFDLVICSSVLHHIPDLPRFFSFLEPLLSEGGYFLSMQDPRAESINDATAQKRKKEYLMLLQKQNNKRMRFEKIRNNIKILLPILVLLRKRGTLEYKVNTQLKRKGIIKHELTMGEIWAITDIHVPNQPGAFGGGIKQADLAAWLNKCECTRYLTYNYFDTNLMNLTPDFIEKESNLLRASDPHGFLFSSLYRKKIYAKGEA